MHVSARTRDKVASRHGLDVDEVVAHLVGIAGLVYTWHDHPEYGRRALVEIFPHGARVLAVLFPTNVEDEFHLGSAYRV